MSMGIFNTRAKDGHACPLCHGMGYRWNADVICELCNNTGRTPAKVDRTQYALALERQGRQQIRRRDAHNYHPMDEDYEYGQTKKQPIANGDAFIGKLFVAGMILIFIMRLVG